MRVGWLFVGICFGGGYTKVVRAFSLVRRPEGSRSRKNNGNRLYASTATTRGEVEEALSRTQQATNLPIFEVVDKIRESVADRPNLLLEASTGAGKTTVLPLALLLNDKNTWSKDDGDKAETDLPNIIMVEPRRIAARSAAQRMASILQQSTGQLVGYAIRGEAHFSSETSITVMTDGVLLNKLRDDPELTGIHAIIFDEFHERGVGSDTALALSVEIQRSLRPDLRLIVMSATLPDETKLCDRLGGKKECHILASEGRLFPVDIQWARKGYPPLGVLMKSRNDLVSTMCLAIEEALRLAPAKGDVLAFLPGAREIERVVQNMRQLLPQNVDIFPLYGSLPKEKQDEALFPPPGGNRRVIVSSPIAEASLTLERVTCVIDSGLRREPRSDVDTGMPRLVTTRCCQASARQRSGRAGRIQEGICLRIYTESEYEQQMLDQSPPEIMNTDLVPTVLLLSDWGCSNIPDIFEIPFVDPPEESALEKAYGTLVCLEALEKSGNRYVLTSLGRSIAELPTHPRLATAIAKADTREKLTAAVMASFFMDDDIGAARRAKETNLALRIRSALEAPTSSFLSKSAQQYASRMGKEALKAILFFSNNRSELRSVVDVIGEALLPGFIDLVAERKGDASYGGSTYMISLGRSARLDRERDGPDYLVVAETSTGDDRITRIRSFASISSEALHHAAQEREVVFTVPTRGHEVRARRALMIGSLELSSSPLPAPSSEEVTEILLQTIRSLGGVNVALMQNLSKDKRSALVELRARVQLASALDDTSDWPTCFSALDAFDTFSNSPEDERALEQLVVPWLAPAGSLKAVNMLDIFRGSLTPDQLVQLDSCYPTKIEAPDGTRIPIMYGSGTPKASAKLQQFFGTTESPCVGPQDNRQPVSLSLLSPAGKELAQTVDLPFFWKETYPSVRAEMRGRYAKHPWPADPMNATPTRQTKKQQSATIGEGEAKGTKKKKGKRRRR